MAVVQDEIERIDPDTKTIHYKSGITAPLSEEASFSLFGSPAQKQIREGVKETELQAHETVGNLTGSTGVNTFLKNLSDNVFTRLATDYLVDPVAAVAGAVSTREGQEDKGFFGRLGENYIAQRMGRRDARKIIDEENPRAALAGKVGAVGIDLATPLGRVGQSPAAVGALFGAGSSDRSVFEDPTEFAKSTAGGAVLGYGLGKVGQGLERVANERRALREFPAVEREAERAYQEGMQRYRATAREKLGRAQKDIGRLGIAKEAVDMEGFLNREIGMSELAGTSEANELRRFFGELYESLPQDLNASDLQRLFETIERRSLRASQETAPIFNSFKEYLVERLPMGAAQNQIMGKIYPKVETEAPAIVNSVFDSLPKNVIKEIETEFGKGAVKNLKDSLAKDLKESLEQLSPQEFYEFLEGGGSSQIVDSILSNPIYQSAAELSNYKVRKNFGSGVINESIAKRSLPESVFETERRVQQIPTQIETNLNQRLRQLADEASILVDETQRRVSSRIANAVGVQNPYVRRPPANIAPGAYQPPSPPQVGGMARRFETQPLRASRQGTEAFGLGALGKLFGIPKIGAALAVGKGAKVGLEGALRGLTSPTALGRFARESVSDGGMKLLVEQISASYPSYDNGIIKDPQERKQAVYEIEMDTAIPFEDKAMLQGYINRGKDLKKLI